MKAKTSRSRGRRRSCSSRVLWTGGVLALVALARWPLVAFGSKAHPPRSYDIRPEVRIPVGPLGYLPPGEIPSFDFHAAVSLHFIDANHLLFAFDINGLLRRNNDCPMSDSQRMVRAVVLDIPSGRVEKQVDWELHDFSDFLWGVGGGQFLLRRCSTLNLVERDLVLHPLLKAAGPILGMTLSPDQSVAVVEVKLKPKAQSPIKTSDQIDGPEGPVQSIDAVFLNLRPLRAFARTSLQIPGVLPIVHNGILETLIAPHNLWVLNLHPFNGPQRQIATVKSACPPFLTPVASNVAIAAVCPKKGEKIFQAYDLNGRALWQIPFAADRREARFILTKNGARFAIESLHATQPIAALDPLNNSNVDREIIDIYDTRTGIEIGSFATTPVYTAGKNVDFSPDGLRLAVLHNGAIEIYTLNELAKQRTGQPQ
ncbi:MAG: hypothetical protein WA708_17180 [Acidobacteriaceae bacterium]